MKNVVFRNIMEIRILKKRPNVGEVIAHFKNISKKSANPNAVIDKKKILRLLTIMYSVNTSNIKIEKQNPSLKFEKISGILGRIQKVLVV